MLLTLPYPETRGWSLVCGYHLVQQGSTRCGAGSQGQGAVMFVQVSQPLGPSVATRLSSALPPPPQVAALCHLLPRWACSNTCLPPPNPQCDVPSSWSSRPKLGTTALPTALSPQPLAHHTPHSAPLRIASRSVLGDTLFKTNSLTKLCTLDMGWSWDGP